VDNFSKKYLSLFVGKSLKGGDVLGRLDQIKQEEMLVPTRIQRDNGSDFSSKEVDKWAYENGLIIDFSRPGKPPDNPYVESFNGKFRDECLSANWFLSLEDAKEKIDAWKRDYNLFRPHSSLNNLSPQEFMILQNKPPKILL